MKNVVKVEKEIGEFKVILYKDEHTLTSYTVTLFHDGIDIQRISADASITASKAYESVCLTIETLAALGAIQNVKR